MKTPPAGGVFQEAENTHANVSAQMFFAQFIA
jgi:hypothetical membrane protein